MQCVMEWVVPMPRLQILQNLGSGQSGPSISLHFLCTHSKQPPQKIVFYLFYARQMAQGSFSDLFSTSRFVPDTRIFVFLIFTCTVNVLKFRTPFYFLFSVEILVIRAGSHKMLVRIANKEDPDQKQSNLGLRCLSMPRLAGQLLFEILEHSPCLISISQTSTGVPSSLLL